MAQYCVYILTNRSGTLYVGVTNDLVRRLYEHKNKLAGGFTKRYNIDRLTHYETTEDVNAAIAREKQIKDQRMDPQKEVRPDSVIERTLAGSVRGLVRLSQILRCDSK